MIRVLQVRFLYHLQQMKLETKANFAKTLLKTLIMVLSICVILHNATISCCQRDQPVMLLRNQFKEQFKSNGLLEPLPSHILWVEHNTSKITINEWILTNYLSMTLQSNLHFASQHDTQEDSESERDGEAAGHGQAWNGKGKFDGLTHGKWTANSVNDAYKHFDIGKNAFKLEDYVEDYKEEYTRTGDAFVDYLGFQAGYLEFEDIFDVKTLDIDCDKISVTEQ